MNGQKEIWLPVNGYEGAYEISNMGQIRSLDRTDSIGRLVKGHILHPSKTPNGYLRLNLCKNGKIKMHSIHRLVADAFLGDCPKGYQVNHIDEDKLNNRATNLEYVSPKQNINWETSLAKRAEKQRNGNVRSKSVVCVETGAVYPSIREAERQTGLRHNEISRCCHKKAKTTGGFHWEWYLTDAQQKQRH